MYKNNNKYNLCISCNNSNGAWGFHWKDSHEEQTIRKSWNHLLVLPIPTPMKYSIAPASWPQMRSSWNKNKRAGMIVITLISFPWVALSYKKMYSPLLLLFTKLWHQCGPGSHLRGRVLRVGVWGKDQASVTVTQFWFILVNHLIL